MPRQLNRDTRPTGISFAAAFAGLLCLVLVIAAWLITCWFSTSAGQPVLEWGLALVVLVPVAVQTWMNRGDRR